MNKLVKINQKQEKQLMEDLLSKGFYIVNIDGSLIHTKVEYMLAIDKAFDFPKGMFKNIDNFDSYFDWMIDLSWLGGQKGYALFIDNFSKMMISEPENKGIIMEYFEHLITYWEHEVVYCSVGGKITEFKVFLED